MDSPVKSTKKFELHWSPAIDLIKLKTPERHCPQVDSDFSTFMFDKSLNSDQQTAIILTILHTQSVRFKFRSALKIHLFRTASNFIKLEFDHLM